MDGNLQIGVLLAGLQLVQLLVVSLHPNTPHSEVSAADGLVAREQTANEEPHH